MYTFEDCILNKVGMFDCEKTQPAWTQYDPDQSQCATMLKQLVQSTNAYLQTNSDDRQLHLKELGDKLNAQAVVLAGCDSEHVKCTR